MNTNKPIGIVKKSPKYDIHQRIYDLVVRMVKLVNRLPKNEANGIISKQLLRSATSMGANDQEADGVLTNKDFLHCCAIVRKETKETLFWLKLIRDTNPVLSEKMESVIQESQEIQLIISSIINNAREKN